jgi:hypothetical protein
MDKEMPSSLQETHVGQHSKSGFCTLGQNAEFVSVTFVGPIPDWFLAGNQ